MRIKRINPTAWYDIPGYDGKYQINFYGKIRRVLKNGRYKELHPYIKITNGSQAVKLNSKEKVVMSLMRKTFIGDLPDGYNTYHRDGCRSNNELSNIGVIEKRELSKLISRCNNREVGVVKLDSNGNIVNFYRSAREAGRQNYMSYQTILDRINGKTKGLYAGDGYVYVKDKDSAIQKAIRRIEMDNAEKCGGVVITKAPEGTFDF